MIAAIVSLTCYVSISSHAPDGPATGRSIYLNCCNSMAPSADWLAGTSLRPEWLSVLLCVGMTGAGRNIKQRRHLVRGAHFPSGVFSYYPARFWGFSCFVRQNWILISVRMQPGQMPLTLIWHVQGRWLGRRFCISWLNHSALGNAVLGNCSLHGGDTLCRSHEITQLPPLPLFWPFPFPGMPGLARKGPLPCVQIQSKIPASPSL